MHKRGVLWYTDLGACYFSFSLTKGWRIRMRYLPVTALLLLSSFGASVSGLHGHHRHEALHHRSKNAPVSKTNPVLLRRDDSSDQEHTCSSHRECDNGACCGKSNVCGFGPVYCGDGCQSNCDAKAECGQYAKVNGTTCPLNVCCRYENYIRCPLSNTHFLCQ